jgi:uncharacterized membrane protein
MAEGIKAIFIYTKTDGELWAVGVIHSPIKNVFFYIESLWQKKMLSVEES